MQDELGRLKLGLRVLGAIIEYRDPEETDIQALRSYAPLLESRPADELACEVIQQVLKARAGVSKSIAEKV